MFELIIVNENNKKILENLLEYYLYDFNIYYEDDLNDSGKFEFIDVEPYINNSNNKAFFVKINKYYAGFILIKQAKDAIAIEEFWIMPKYRKGIFAFKVLNKILSEIHGKVEFMILNKNKRWLRVIKYLASKNYKILKVENIKRWDTEDFTKFTILCK